MATRYHHLLPALIHGGSYLNLAQSALGQLVIAVNVTTPIMVFRTTRGRTVFDLGLAIAVLAAAIDTILTMRAGTRFRLGWHIARVSSVVSALSVLIVYRHEVTWLCAGVICLNQRLAEQAAINVTTDLFNRRYFNHQRDSGAARRDAASRGDKSATYRCALL